LPVQAFIAAAAKDQSVRWMTMVDSDGVIRGSSNPKLLGTRYHVPVVAGVVHREGDVTVTNIKLDDGSSGFLFVHPILYAGRHFGLIEVSISKAELEAAAATSRNLLVGLGLVILMVVAGVSFAMAKLLVQPVRRLKLALRDAAMGDLDFRISHSRRDEFGELFDGFNLFATGVQDRLEAAERPSGGPRPLDATRIEPPPAHFPSIAGARDEAEARSAESPLHRAWRRRNA